MSKLKVKVFIDGSNIYFAQKKMDKWLDWVKVKRHLTRRYNVVEVRYYAGRRSNDKRVQSFLIKLEKIGFLVVSKLVKKIRNEMGREIEKANFDVEITGDVLESSDELDTVVLFSGDSDFHYLAKLLRKKGKQLFVYSSRQTLSWELKLSADKYFLLEDLPHLTKGRKFVRI